MRVAPEGWLFIIIAWALVVICAVLHWYIPAIILVPVAIWVVAFFRDPVRDKVRGPDLILAPADGKVVSIISIDEPAYMKGPSTRVAIFMNVFSVHVNRYPADGTVAYRHYGPGKFL
ncbi:MAG: phosphatidylserine decarboxylase, partial [Gemmatimonadota bacterium]